ncbi:zinc-binding alcohol dehydrogenase [Oleomonas cavernae]|uniref:Zinc-binding alcohol dehydrogenase n=2 Tax=Oleomonas cavernae TaxID=2320859 RepID=A0A418WJR5_9PROT|nr:zinc-binding alcohol dehydrogenase [Oleomonas cavernae]
MRAVVMRNGALELATAPIPRPGPGEVLVKTLATGICGSDLHCVAHGDRLLASARAVTGVDIYDPKEPVILGHEFCAQVVEHGPGTRVAHPVGMRVVSVPFLLRPQPVTIGFGGFDTPGGFAEYMVLSEDLLIPVPDNVPNDIATLAEPLAVALHAVNRGKLGPDDVPLVIGCGPIGLTVIAILKMRGIGPIVAADFSPSRRAMATRLGADLVVDPRETSPYDSWRSVAAAPDPARHGRQTPMFPQFAYRPSAIFECVGVPGIIQQVLAGAPPCAKIVVAGLCMEHDSFQPAFGIFKEVDMSFCIAYTVEEFAQAFAHIAAGEVHIGALITGHVGLEGVPDAFARLADPERDAKVIIVP